jgi:hypothetical protein
MNHPSLYMILDFSFTNCYTSRLLRYMMIQKKERACFYEPHVSLHDTWFLFYKLLYVTTITLRNDSLVVKS